MNRVLEQTSRDSQLPGTDAGGPPRGGWLAAGGVLTALLASSCCVLPLLLVTLGIGGAWLGNLTALEPYRPWFLGGAVLLLSAGFWQVYRRPRKACADGSYCARPASGRITKAALWLATLLVFASATVDLWAPLLY